MGLISEAARMDLNKPHKSRRVEPDYVDPWWTPYMFGAVRFCVGAFVGVVVSFRVLTSDLAADLNMWSALAIAVLPALALGVAALFLLRLRFDGQDEHVGDR